MPPSPSPALERVLDVLRCPVCRDHLHPGEGALRCPAGHTFDLARQGYVSLLSGGRATSGDDAAMVRARQRFLATGRFAPLQRALARTAADVLPDTGTVLDVGCGTGHYLAEVLAQVPGARGLGLDTSTRALRAAARCHPRAAVANCDVFRPLPLVDRGIDVILNVFAPRNPAEFHRVLRPTGRLLVARPSERHLAELRASVPGMVTVDPAKEERLHQALTPHFHPVVTREVTYTTPLTRQETLDLVGMTPSARHLSPAALDGHHALPDAVTVAVLVSSYRPR